MELSARIPAAGAGYAFAYHLLGEASLVLSKSYRCLNHSRHQVFAVCGAALITLEYGQLGAMIGEQTGACNHITDPNRPHVNIKCTPMPGHVVCVH